jgi:DNA mismatch repair protein MutL
LNDIIHLLPDTVANQIAAGEVVQRPSSIIKEMVENSIDAEATDIQVLVTDAGKTCVQIIDNGKGMSETDARLSFERHATSKIRSAEDLFQLHTMGFRGEALASIAAVSQIDLKTRRKEDELGTYIRICGSRIEQQEPVMCPVGCNFSVNNIFYNVPARRKFLKSNQTELTNIVSEFERMVLVYPQISFSLHSNGAEVFRLPSTSLRQRIVDVFGKKINADLLPVEAETSLVSVSGFVGKPESSKKKGARQFFFVNGRYMRHPYFHSAVVHAYDNLVPPGEHVSYFIYLSVEASNIDVNVHPTKTEIKFDNEQAIWQVLTAVVKEALGKYSNVPSIDFDVEDRPYIPVMGLNDGSAKPPVMSPLTYNPFKSGSQPLHSQRPSEWESLYKGVENFHLDGDAKTKGSQSLVDSSEEYIVNSLIGQHRQPSSPELWNPSSDGNAEMDQADFSDIDTLPHFQYKGRFIVTPFTTGILVVDQHRAHVRILYEENLLRIQNQETVSQGMLFPELIQFSPNECIAVEAILEQLGNIGFELTNLGGGTYSIQGVPAGIEGLNPSTLLHDLVYAAIESGLNVKEKVNHAIALAMAQSSAIVYGQVLTNDEMTQLLSRLFKLNTPLRTPDGKIVFNIIDQRQIEKMF